MQGPRHFVFLVLDGFPHICLSCAIEPLRLANHLAGRTIYSWSAASLDGGPVTASNGIETPVQHGLVTLDRRTNLMVIAGDRAVRDAPAELSAYLRRQRAQGAMVGGICSGAYLLARAGLLAGKEAALHWAYHDAFAESFPKVTLTRSLFVADKVHPTCSGGTATLDLMLHILFEDHGRDLALGVAEQLVCAGMRDATTMQRPSAQFRSGGCNTLLTRAIDLMTSNIETPFAAREIAEEIGISCRRLERLFARHLGVAPMRYAMELRLGRARNLLLQSEVSISEIAVACGFSSPSHFSKSFRARFGHPPRKARMGQQTKAA